MVHFGGISDLFGFSLNIRQNPNLCGINSLDMPFTLAERVLLGKKY